MKHFTKQLYHRVASELEYLYDARDYIYSSSEAKDGLLLMYCLTGVKVDKKQTWLVKLEEEGKLHLTEDYRLHLPYPIFKKLLTVRL